MGGAAWLMRTVILATLGVTCQVLVFPPFEWTSLAWLAALPVFLLFPASGAALGVATAWLIGSIAMAVVVSPWLWPSMAELFEYGGATRAALLFVVVQAVGGLPFALLGLVLQRGGRLTPLPRVLFAPSAWVGVEYLRAHAPFGTPWALLGCALAESPYASQVADLGGVYALSFLAALASAGLREALAAIGEHSGSDRQRRAAILTAGAVLAATFGYGIYRRGEIEALTASAPAVRVATVHAEVPAVRAAPPDLAIANLERHLALSPPSTADVDLVLWPENAVAVLLEENPALVARINTHGGRIPYFVGAPRMVIAGAHPSLRASAFLINPSGIAASYEKRRLLPVAETAPSLGGAGIGGARGFSAGGGPPVIEVGGLRMGSLTVGPLICYEAIFPELARDALRAGADLFVNLSNDAWFRDGSGPRQHLLFARLRAVEFRRTLVRAANRGTTTVILPSGRTLWATDGRTPGVEVAEVPLPSVRTLYARVGDAFAVACLCGVGLVLVARRW